MFDTQHQNLPITGCNAWDELNSQDIEKWDMEIVLCLQNRDISDLFAPKDS